jgi:hypothetical protein
MITQKDESIFPIYEFKPTELFSGKCLRYNNGLWTPDDNEYDLAFITLGDNFAFGVDMPYQKNLAWSWCKKMRWGAFVEKHPNSNAWHYMSKDGTNNFRGDWNRSRHPNVVAMDQAMHKMSSMKGCANGRYVEFNPIDKTINANLLREVETKKIIKPPDVFKCVYCGDINWREEDKQ